LDIRDNEGIVKKAMVNITEKHIFLLNDGPTIREVLWETLEDYQFKVSYFEDSVECLSRLGYQKCDLLVIDLKNPEKDGLEILMNVQHLVPWIPVLIITGYGNIQTAVKAIKAGATDFIEKPLDKKNFVTKVKSILKDNLAARPELDTPLTPTERKVLQLVLNGMKNNEIANLLNRSKRTIEVHRAHIMHKFGVDNLVDLVKRALSMGLVSREKKRIKTKINKIMENDEQAIKCSTDEALL
jgi:two-component system response regulator FixJ